MEAYCVLPFHHVPKSSVLVLGLIRTTVNHLNEAPSYVSYVFIIPSESVGHPPRDRVTGGGVPLDIRPREIRKNVGVTRIKGKNR